MPTPPIQHRAQQDLHRKMQPGVVQAITTVRQPPAGFPKGPRCIALIQLQDGSRVMGGISAEDTVTIGQWVRPQLRLQRVNEQGLRLYDVIYEPAAPVPQTPAEFPGYIIALSGPSGVGKSTVSDLLVSAAADYVVKVPIVTTRRQKTGDDGEYTYTTTKKFEEMRQRGEIIAHTTIPSKSEKRQYGYLAADIQRIWNEGKTPVVITEQQLLEGLAKHFGRRSLLSFGLLPPGKSKRVMLSQLLHRLRSRGRDSEASIADRMKNAESDLDFLHQQSDMFDSILVNEQLDSVIDALKEQVLARKKA